MTAVVLGFFWMMFLGLVAFAIGFGAWLSLDAIRYAWKGR